MGGDVAVQDVAGHEVTEPGPGPDGRGLLLDIGGVVVDTGLHLVARLPDDRGRRDFQRAFGVLCSCTEQARTGSYPGSSDAPGYSPVRNRPVFTSMTTCDNIRPKSP
jgi:hypothetical protein